MKQCHLSVAPLAPCLVLNNDINMRSGHLLIEFKSDGFLDNNVDNKSYFYTRSWKYYLGISQHNWCSSYWNLFGVNKIDVIKQWRVGYVQLCIMFIVW